MNYYVRSHLLVYYVTQHNNNWSIYANNCLIFVFLSDTADVYIPRFTISTTHELKEALNKLGIEVFSDQTDLSGITGVRELKVSKVSQTCFPLLIRFHRILTRSLMVWLFCSGTGNYLNTICLEVQPIATGGTQILVLVCFIFTHPCHCHYCRCHMARQEICSKQERFHFYGPPPCLFKKHVAPLEIAM